MSRFKSLSFLLAYLVPALMPIAAWLGHSSGHIDAASWFPLFFLFVLLQQVRAFRGQDILSLLERLVLVLKLIANMDQRVDALLEAFQLVLKKAVYVLRHAANIVTPSAIINRQRAGGVG
jgi:hypothetical protein